MYYIKISYPTGEQAFALHHPLPNPRQKNKHIWSSKSFNYKTCAFESLYQCKNYIANRFKKTFNREYRYFIFKSEGNNDCTLIRNYIASDFGW